MLIKWINNITKKLFKNDKNYRSKYVVDNIDRVELKDILEIDISLLTQYRSYNRLTMSGLLEQINALHVLLDENTYSPVPMMYTVVIDKNRKIKLIDILDNGDGAIPNDYRELLCTYINIVTRCKELLKDVDVKNDIDLRFNWNVLNTHIITMEEIVNSLYIRLAI